MRHPRLLLDQGALSEAPPAVKVIDLKQGFGCPFRSGLGRVSVVDEHLDLARLDDEHLVARLTLVEDRVVSEW